jgi:hypothetical protein
MSTPAQPGIAADRFAHKIVGFLKALPALAAAECQTVSPLPKLCIFQNEGGYMCEQLDHRASPTGMLYSALGYTNVNNLQ